MYKIVIKQYLLQILNGLQGAMRNTVAITYSNTPSERDAWDYMQIEVGLRNVR